MSKSESSSSNVPVEGNKEKEIIRTLEEDDEFEDFPDDSKWSEEPNQTNNESNLWEEDWEDVDDQDEFTRRLREELKKALKGA